MWKKRRNRSNRCRIRGSKRYVSGLACLLRQRSNNSRTRRTTKGRRSCTSIPHQLSHKIRKNTRIHSNPKPVQGRTRYHFPRTWSTWRKRTLRYANRMRIAARMRWSCGPTVREKRKKPTVVNKNKLKRQEYICRNNKINNSSSNANYQLA